MLAYLYVAAGGALGSAARFALAGAVAQALQEKFPFGTLVVNVSGSFLIGLLASLTGPGGRLVVPLDVSRFLITGFCGGYTTFSSFSLQTLVLARDGDVLRAAANIVASVALCLLGVYGGTLAGSTFNGTKGA